MAPLYPPNIFRANLKAIAPFALVFLYVSCRLLTRSHLASFLETRITYLLHGHCCPSPFMRSNRSGVRAGHGPPGHLPICSGRFGVPVAHSAQANSDPFPGHMTHIPALLRPLGLPVEQRARADPDPSVHWQSCHMTLITATPPGPGYIPPARVHAPAGQAQSSKSPGKLRTQQATEGVRRGYYDKVYVVARLKLYIQRTRSAVAQGVSRTQRHLLFGTQCRPVGGPAGFEPH
jgi:hypothetical protein